MGASVAVVGAPAGLDHFSVRRPASGPHRHEDLTGPLVEAAEADPPLLEVGHHFDQVPQGPGQAVKSPYPRMSLNGVVDGLGQLRSSVRAPVACSTKIRWQPAAVSSSTCRSGFWSAVDTRA